MTIKELCEKTQYCKDCAFKVVCSEYAIRDEPPTQLDANDVSRLTNSIIETAKLLESED